MKAGEMGILTRDAILNAQDLAEEVVPVPEWGGAVKVRGLSLSARVHILEMTNQSGGNVNVARAETLTFVMGVVEPSFTEGDCDALRAKSNAAITRVNRAIMRLSGIGTAAEADALKNSEATPSDNSNIA